MKKFILYGFFILLGCGNKNFVKQIEMQILPNKTLAGDVDLGPETYPIRISLPDSIDRSEKITISVENLDTDILNAGHCVFALSKDLKQNTSMVVCDDKISEFVSKCFLISSKHKVHARIRISFEKNHTNDELQKIKVKAEKIRYAS